MWFGSWPNDRVLYTEPPLSTHIGPKFGGIMASPSQPDLWGEHEHFVDDKGRLLCPTEFRDSLGEEFVVTRGPENTLFIFPMPVWSTIEQNLQTHVLNKHSGLLQRMLGGRALTRLDPQGRMTIPRHLREWANLNELPHTVLVGQGSKVEIWPKSKWIEYRKTAFSFDAMYEAADAVGLGIGALTGAAAA